MKEKRQERHFLLFLTFLSVSASLSHCSLSFDLIPASRSSIRQKDGGERCKMYSSWKRSLHRALEILLFHAKYILFTGIGYRLCKRIRKCVAHDGCCTLFPHSGTLYSPPVSLLHPSKQETRRDFTLVISFVSRLFLDFTRFATSLRRVLCSLVHFLYCIRFACLTKGR